MYEKNQRIVCASLLAAIGILTTGMYEIIHHSCAERMEFMKAHVWRDYKDTSSLASARMLNTQQILQADKAINDYLEAHPEIDARIKPASMAAMINYNNSNNSLKEVYKLRAVRDATYEELDTRIIADREWHRDSALEIVSDHRKMTDAVRAALSIGTVAVQRAPTSIKPTVG